MRIRLLENWQFADLSWLVQRWDKILCSYQSCVYFLIVVAVAWRDHVDCLRFGRCDAWGSLICRNRKNRICCDIERDLQSLWMANDSARNWKLRLRCLMLAVLPCWYHPISGEFYLLMSLPLHRRFLKHFDCDACSQSCADFHRILEAFHLFGAGRKICGEYVD